MLGPERPHPGAHPRLRRLKWKHQGLLTRGALLDPFVVGAQEPLALKDRLEPLAELPLKNAGQLRQQGLQFGDLLLCALQLQLAFGQGRLQVLVLQRPVNKKPPGT